MTASASGAARTDIHKGDLIKATRKTDPEEHRQGRVVRINEFGAIFTSGLLVDLNHYDIEVLDRPLPPINHEFARVARRLFYLTDQQDFGDIKAVIHFVREHDRKNATKENA